MPPADLQRSILEPIEVLGILNLRLESGEGCVVAMRIGRRRGSVDEGLRRRRRRPLLVGRRGVRVMRRVVRRVVAEAACTTQQKAAVTRRRCHIVVVILVHGPVMVLRVMRMPRIRRVLVDITGMLTIPKGRGKVPHGHGGDIFL